MWRVTPPGYVHEYGDTRAMRIVAIVASVPGAAGAVTHSGPAGLRSHAALYPPVRVNERHFVKYTFLKVEPAWRRLDADERLTHKQEFLAACEDFGADHLLQSFSLVGTRGDTDLMLVAEAENLDRIHELHVVLGQSGLMKWATQPYSFLGIRKGSEYSEDKRLVPRPFRGRYLFVYPFVKTRAWYAIPADERYRIMQGHIAIGREYPQVDNHTTYSFGLDDQEFVVAFDTDDAGAFLDLVQRLRTTEASAYTLRDTPSFTCLRVSLERALGALDGEPVPSLQSLS
jgi:chlorite dismutase